MENSSSQNLKVFYYKFGRLGLFNSSSKIYIFLQRTCRNKQRLIPLTRDIQKAMVDFNGSLSTTNVLEKPIYRSISIMSLLRSEIQNNLQELSLSAPLMSKDNIDEILDRYLKEKVVIIRNCDKAQCSEDINDEFEVTVEEMTDGKDKNKLISEKIEILENRVATLEARLSSMLQTIPKLKHIQAKRFKININNIKDQINALYNNDKSKTERTQDKSSLLEYSNSNKVANCNIYDDIFYASREYTLNLLNYKKSSVTINLNRKPRRNPYIKPVYSAVEPLKHSNRCPKFFFINDARVE